MLIVRVDVLRKEMKLLQFSLLIRPDVGYLFLSDTENQRLKKTEFYIKTNRTRSRCAFKSFLSFCIQDIIDEQW